jgi:hypothetical protein
MKSKFILIAIMAIVSVSVVSVAYAQKPTTRVGANATVEFGTASNVENTVNNQTATSTKVKTNQVATTTRGNATSTQNNRASTTPGAQGKLMSETHRSTVATFVHSLLSVADREGGIGTQVRTVAQSQNNSASTTVTAIKMVEDRGSLRTFLAGSDYKNLGVIRSEIATTSANIEKLKKLLSQATSDADKAELTVQIKALEEEKMKIDNYVKKNEERFSLFGWFNKLFVK